MLWLGKTDYFGLRMPKMKQDLDKNNENLPDYLGISSMSRANHAVDFKGRGIKYYQMMLKPMFMSSNL